MADHVLPRTPRDASSCTCIIAERQLIDRHLQEDVKWNRRRTVSFGFLEEFVLLGNRDRVSPPVLAPSCRSILGADELPKTPAADRVVIQGRFNFVMIGPGLQPIMPSSIRGDPITTPLSKRIAG
jgi:hypothetical protein